MRLKETLLYLTALKFLSPTTRAHIEPAEILTSTDRLRLGLVFGIDLAMDGATSAVSLPDGRIVGLATVKGGQDYVSLMRDWHEICTRKGATQEEKKELALSFYPAPSAGEREALHKAQRAFEEASPTSWGRLDWLQDLFLGDRRDLESFYTQTYFKDDEAVHIISSVLSGLREATLLALDKETSLPIPKRPYTEIALPGWLFTNIIHLQDDGKPIDKHLTYVSAANYREFGRRASVAAHRAGFRRSVEDDPKQIMSLHSQGDHILGPPPGPSMAIRSAVNGTCKKTSDEEKTCQFKTRQEQEQHLQLVALIDYRRLDDTDVVTLWLQDSLGTHPRHVDWLSWKVSKDEEHKHHEQQLVVDRIATEIQKAANGLNTVLQVNPDEEISILLTGERWLDSSLPNLLASPQLENVGVRVVHGEEDPFLSAVSVAEAARYVWFEHNVHHVEDDYYLEVFRRNRGATQREL